MDRFCTSLSSCEAGCLLSSLLAVYVSHFLGPPLQRLCHHAGSVISLIKEVKQKPLLCLSLHQELWGS